MAITKVGAMTDPLEGDYAILQAKLDAYAKQIGMILTVDEYNNSAKDSYG